MAGVPGPHREIPPPGRCPSTWINGVLIPVPPQPSPPPARPPSSEESLPHPGPRPPVLPPLPSMALRSVSRRVPPLQPAPVRTGEAGFPCSRLCLGRARHVLPFSEYSASQCAPGPLRRPLRARAHDQLPPGMPSFGPSRPQTCVQVPPPCSSFLHTGASFCSACVCALRCKTSAMLGLNHRKYTRCPMVDGNALRLVFLLTTGAVSLVFCKTGNRQTRIFIIRQNLQTQILAEFTAFSFNRVASCSFSFRAPCERPISHGGSVCLLDPAGDPVTVSRCPTAGQCAMFSKSV